ncbi:hypothetical protein [Bacteriovorax sp. Seq25_V]|uniref:hypothetical protein n=1 Tax=Bacteriovorax sp. Seq25_V TaxID=1201288 RepID=UPI000389FDE0|nr:hypothetical protein [Bacteriovorax sp. Seq25_V]EQC47283.1 hypothetical protein M900_0938 [Bacteriovorax sp. Seq25_V]
MIQDVYDKILENVDVTAMDKFKNLLQKSITVAIIPENDPKPYIETLSFKFGPMLEGLESLAGSKGKDKTLIVGTQMLAAIFNGLELNVDDAECFLLFQLRKLGRFRKRESDLLAELKRLWKDYPEYELSDIDFSKALKSLMREKLLLYRKGNIQLNTSFVIRYRID